LRIRPHSTIRAGNSVILPCFSASPDGLRAAAGLDNGCVVLLNLDDPEQPETVRFLGLADGGWAVFYNDHHYRLEGHPAGRFWWSAGLCRFEPGELDGHGITRAE
jgi:hypothetical protein